MAIGRARLQVPIHPGSRALNPTLLPLEQLLYEFDGSFHFQFRAVSAMDLPFCWDGKEIVTLA
jgi:hypothetical protein